MKYDLDILLLYIDKALPKEQLEEISEYLSKNPKDLQYVMELATNKLLDEVQINKIKFETTKDSFVQFCSGLVKLLQEEKLAFRGNVKGCEYSFLDITLKFIYLQDDVFQLQLESKTPVYCEIVKTKDNSIVFQDELTKSNLIPLDVGSLYHLIVHVDDELKILEIML